MRDNYDFSEAEKSPFSRKEKGIFRVEIPNYIGALFMDANIPAEKKKHDMKIVFTITIHKEEKWYVAKCLENGIASQGETMEGAMGNLREAVELYYEDAELPPFPQTYVTVMEVSL